MSDDEHKDKGFLSRWSQRKVQVRQAVPSAAALPAAATPPVPAAAAGLASTPPTVAGVDGAQRSSALAAAAPSALGTPAPGDARPPGPTMQDVDALTPESDYSRFVARDVDPLVKNSAMKKLFADPHYNVMDRLDTYIDDYNTPDPIPKAMFRQLVQARMLGLLDDELEDQDLASRGQPAPATPLVVEDADADADAVPEALEAAEAAEAADAGPHEPSAGQALGTPLGAPGPGLAAAPSALEVGVDPAGTGPQLKPLVAG